ncbi:MAG TPA: PfkB family carbohydrate kinase [Chitinophagaceae bacterium]|nr:PfkB family carbohydrate kinase [Chitinophagaceae bacterium]
MSKPVICIGAAFVDEIFHMKEEMIIASTVPATVTKSAGGVSRNIAHQLALLGVEVQLVTVFGNDSDGDWLKQVSVAASVKIDASITKEGLSGKYTGILNLDGSLFTAFLTNAATDLITPQHLEQYRALLQSASYLLADANISASAGAWLLAFSKETAIPLVLEPVSVPPARKFRNVNLDGLYLVTPNEDELPVLCSEKSFITQLQIEELLAKGIENIWLHNGQHGSALYSKERSITLHAPEIEIVDCTGAGDGSLTGFILGKTLGRNDLDCMRIAHTLSAEILQVNGAIATHLDQEKLLGLVSKYYPD